jgi:hypothetical protein
MWQWHRKEAEADQLRCGGELLLWDEAKQDCIPWAYVDQAPAQEPGEQKGGA